MNNLTCPIVGIPKEKIRYYPDDSGVDIYVPVGTEVVSAVDGHIIYSEPGHTNWNKPPDTANSILISLNRPIEINKKNYYYVWYTHLSELYFEVKDDNPRKPMIKKGTPVGKTGIGNKVPHLHFGLLISREQRDKYDWLAPADLQDLLYDAIDDDIKKTKDFIEIWGNNNGCQIKENGIITPINLYIKFSRRNTENDPQ